MEQNCQYKNENGFCTNPKSIRNGGKCIPDKNCVDKGYTTTETGTGTSVVVDPPKKHYLVGRKVLCDGEKGTIIWEDGKFNVRIVFENGAIKTRGLGEIKILG